MLTREKVDTWGRGTLQYTFYYRNLSWHIILNIFERPLTIKRKAKEDDTFKLAGIYCFSVIGFELCENLFLLFSARRHLSNN